MQPDKLLSHPQALCNILRRVAIEAGHATLEYFDEAGFFDVEAKGDGSPVTIADRAAEAIIVKALRDLLPSVPLIAEEEVAGQGFPDITGQDYLWLVDPIDGTKEFITGSTDYTVNIALVHKGNPLIGVVYAPAKGELYMGCGPETASRWVEESDKEKPISVRPVPSDGHVVTGSRNHEQPAALDAFLMNYKVSRVIKRGSSLKICAIAAGKADLYPRFGPTSEWDTAAADAVLRSAGGSLIDMSGKKLRYGKVEQKFINPAFVAAGDEFQLVTDSSAAE